MTEAAAGFAYLFGDAVLSQPTKPFELRVVDEGLLTITLAWDPVEGAIGYRFSRAGWFRPSGAPRYSTSFDATLSQTRFLKSAWYCVEALGRLDDATYPARSALISLANLET